MRRPRWCWALVLAIVAGCTSVPMRIAPTPPEGLEVTREADGSACGVLLLGIIPIGVNSRAERAYNQAVHRAGAIGLVDTKVTDRWYWIYIGGMVCTDIHGTGYRVPATTTSSLQ